MYEAGNQNSNAVITKIAECSPHCCWSASAISSISSQALDEQRVQWENGEVCVCVRLLVCTATSLEDIESVERYPESMCGVRHAAGDLLMILRPKILDYLKSLVEVPPNQIPPQNPARHFDDSEQEPEQEHWQPGLQGSAKKPEQARIGCLSLGAFPKQSIHGKRTKRKVRNQTWKNKTKLPNQTTLQQETSIAGRQLRKNTSMHYIS